MQEVDVYKNNGVKSRTFIIATTVLTVIWFAVLIAIVYFSKQCDPSDGWSSPSLIQKYVSCRQSNEIGDFLAGAFSPVAFAWLVVTVIIQASELKEQRNELVFSRKVAEDQRLALDQQAKESAAQTAILQQELYQRKQEYKDKEVVSILEQFVESFSTGRNSLIKFEILANGSFDTVNILPKKTKILDVNVRMISEEFARLQRRIETGEIGTVGHDYVGGWRWRMEKLWNERQENSFAMQRRLYELPLMDISSFLNKWGTHKVG